MEKIILNSIDGYKLDIHVFDTNTPKAVIQIIHGMEEHQERYEVLARFLNDNGFSVVSSNMRGHGQNAEILGYFKEKDGYKELIEDQKNITEFIKNRFNNIPIYIFAHSMGTIITRVLLQENSKNYEKVVLSGYPNYQKGAYFGIIIASIVKLFKGAKYKSKLLNNLSIGSFNKSIKDSKTDCDWICSNEETVKKYIEDPFCGFGFTCSAFSDLYHLVIIMNKPKLYNNVNNQLNLLFIRVIDDPCVGGIKGTNNSRNVLISAGFDNIQSIDYPNMRHELLAERDNQKVYDDILSFYNL